MRKRWLVAVFAGFVAACASEPPPATSAQPGGVDRALIAAQETSAIVSLTTILTAQIAYSAACANGAYARSLRNLAAPSGGSGAGFLPAELGSSDAPSKSGYRFTMGPGAGAKPGPADCDGRPTVTGYYATATPVTPGSSGTKSFAVNSTNAIWALDGGTPPPEPFKAPAVVVR